MAHTKMYACRICSEFPNRQHDLCVLINCIERINVCIELVAETPTKLVAKKIPDTRDSYSNSLFTFGAIVRQSQHINLVENRTRWLTVK